LGLGSMIKGFIIVFLEFSFKSLKLNVPGSRFRV